MKNFLIKFGVFWLRLPVAVQYSLSFFGSMVLGVIVNWLEKIVAGQTFDIVQAKQDIFNLGMTFLSIVVIPAIKITQNKASEFARATGTSEAVVKPAEAKIETLQDKADKLN